MATSPRPNILLITSDQQHWNTLGFLNPEVLTPVLDRLASEGTFFTRAYCVNPTCTPTRASIITGRYPSQHGAWSLGTKLPETELTIGEILSRAGYRTALIGKAHFQPLASTEEYSSLESYPIMQDLEFWRNFRGPFYGFEHVELARNHGDEAHVGQHYAVWMEEKGLKNWRDHFRPPTGNHPPQRGRWSLPLDFHYDCWISEKTNEFLERCALSGDNFFIWASFFDPHPPYLVPEPYDRLYDPEKITLPSVTPGEHGKNPPHFQLTQQQKPDFSAYRESGFAMHGFHSHIRDKKELAKDIAIYYGMITLMDEHIGRILAKLHELKLEDNTLVVFTTDHGHLYGQHGLIAKGAFHYEDLIRVPLIVRYPGKVPPGTYSNTLISLVDMAPTFLRIVGLEVPRTMTGIDQSDVWFGKKKSVRTHVVVENRHEPTTVYAVTYVEQRYKITVYYNQDYGELFDLDTDPEEINNLWSDQEFAELKSKMLLKLVHALLGNEPMWMPRVAGA
ncbi:MAG: sulfatase family protein [Armatimonadota bacterium]